MILNKGETVTNCSLNMRFIGLKMRKGQTNVRGPQKYRESHREKHYALCIHDEPLFVANSIR